MLADVETTVADVVAVEAVKGVEVAEPVTEEVTVIAVLLIIV